MKINDFKKLPILGIMRGVKSRNLEPLLETVIQAGLKTIEITMNTAGADLLIREAIKTSGKSLAIGAGTVTDMKSLHLALDSGAGFIVMPVLVREVVEHCAKNGIPVFPGALTPKEIFDAWEAGATMVKVFPAKFFGPEYFREIKGPFQNIELLACAGVTPGNLKAYFENGASAVSFGSGVFRNEWIEKKNYTAIGSRIGEYIDSFENAARR